MSGLGEIELESFRTDERTESRYREEMDLACQGNKERKRSKKRRNSGGSEGCVRTSTLSYASEERRGEDKIGGQGVRRQADNREQYQLPTYQVDHQAQFYERYRGVAEEYDKGFIKKYDEDLNTTLIFAGLFSAVTSAFVILIDPYMQPSAADETVHLLRVLLYKTDNTTFGGHVPHLPSWPGPDPTFVYIQTMLVASLFITLFASFLAVLAKQWLNRYEMADMRGSATERSLNRQRKLDGVVAWYFDSVMESLPLMLQVALFLFGCAMWNYLFTVSYLFDGDNSIALVVYSITLFGGAIYIFITITGLLSESCPYQTSGSYFLRYLAPKLWKVLYSSPRVISSALGNTFREAVRTIRVNAQAHRPWWSRGNIMRFSQQLISDFPLAIAVDARCLWQVVTQALVLSSTEAYHLLHRMKSLLHGTSPTPEQRSTVLGPRCISWTLKTSLDKVVHLSALEYLMSMQELAEFDSTLVIDCFNTFIGCISVSDQRVAIKKGLDQLATVSAGCFGLTFHRLSILDPTSSVLADLRRRYSKILPSHTNFEGPWSSHTMTMAHAVVTKSWDHCSIAQDDDRPSDSEHILITQLMAEVAQVEYQLAQGQNVPPGILCFAFHSLFLDPLPPASVTTNCLKVIAIDLGCDISDIETLDKSVQMGQVSSVITQKLEAMIEAGNQAAILSKNQAICALLPYAIFLEKGGQQGMVDTIVYAARASKKHWFMDPVTSYIATLFGKPSLDRVITLVSPHLHWGHGLLGGKMVVEWAAAALAASDTEEISQSMVDTLLQIVSIDSLQPYIPCEVWTQLKKQPPLPPLSQGQYWGTTLGAVHYVRRLGDLEIIKSYFLLVWSEWNRLCADGMDEMEALIKEEFSGSEMQSHRKDLIKRLDCVLRQLDQGPDYLDGRHIQLAKWDYGRLRAVLLEVNREQ